MKRSCNILLVALRVEEQYIFREIWFYHTLLSRRTNTHSSNSPSSPRLTVLRPARITSGIFDSEAGLIAYVTGLCFCYSCIPAPHVCVVIYRLSSRVADCCCSWVFLFYLRVEVYQYDFASSIPISSGRGFELAVSSTVHVDGRVCMYIARYVVDLKLSSGEVAVV